MCLKKKEYRLLECFEWSCVYKLITDDNIELFYNVIKENLKFANYLFDIIEDKIINNPKILKLYLKLSETYFNKAIEYINHNNDQEQINDASLKLIFSFLLKTTNLNKDHLMKLKDLFGYKILSYYKNDNIKEIINLNNYEFEKILNLFPNLKYNVSDLEIAYDSIKQHEFGIKNPKIIFVFNNILTSLTENNNDYLEYLNNLCSVMDERFNEYFYQKYPFLYNKLESPKELLLTIIDKIKNGNYSENKLYTEILHTITTYYLDRMRGEYKKKYKMNHEIILDYYLEPASLQNAFLNYYIENFAHVLINLMVQNGFEQQLALEIIDYYISHKFHKNSTYSEKLITSNIDKMIKIAKQGMKEYFSSIEEVELITIKTELDYKNKVKRIYRVTSDLSNVYEILKELNIESIKKHLLSVESEEVYNKLISIIEKNKMHLLPKELCEYLKIYSDEIDISYNYQDFAAFINYFYKIFEKYKQIYISNGKSLDNFNLNLSEVLINSATYSKMSSINSLILGSVDYDLIRSNPRPNSAYQKNTSERINESIERTFKNFKRKVVKVPTFNEIVNIDKDKKMQVIVGNFTHPSNISHGERTGSCVRVGGAGYSLYEFCLDNPYGFHIRFEDPKTHEYISRVSGFRNGNTVFLNELRYSCNLALYSNIDVVNSCKKVAELLIEKSKDSNSPIENVVISNQYAMKEVEYKVENLKVLNIKKGLGAFYSDVDSNCIILKTSAKDSPFVPVNLDNSMIPNYLPAREKVIETYDRKTIVENINRVHLIRKKLLGEMYEYEEPILVEDFIYGISNQDFYIYVDSNFEIHEEIIEEDERAIEELKKARIKLQKFINSKTKINTEREVKHAI